MVGANDHMQEVNTQVWVYSMEKESKATSRFYSYTFELLANRVLATHLKMSRRQITSENCETVYKVLINNIIINE